ncbi:hypothetical protein L211DRAFT_96189 [Terfezia boudieri ATCC MYA-4762]|uniref:Uncharacterized protein n=1 Tax=Terfezia boudieri ATCC MYA-4762 TaxID=1051890 RepID=A0A3N4LVS3_9PEZI|nr:hypothetical protein L211DRAFT_96189 [Terfezia boudieri ATCC MYA-4762]
MGSCIYNYKFLLQVQYNFILCAKRGIPTETNTEFSISSCTYKPKLLLIVCTSTRPRRKYLRPPPCRYIWGASQILMPGYCRFGYFNFTKGRRVRKDFQCRKDYPKQACIRIYYYFRIRPSCSLGIPLENFRCNERSTERRYSRIVAIIKMEICYKNPIFNASVFLRMHIKNRAKINDGDRHPVSVYCYL